MNDAERLELEKEELIRIIDVLQTKLKSEREKAQGLAEALEDMIVANFCHCSDLTNDVKCSLCTAKQALAAWRGEKNV